jgi:threonyl-tRNA synthetase
VVTTITSEADDYAEEVLAKLRKAGLRAEIDLRNEKINYKVREHSVTKVPVIIVCGKREAEVRSVNVRRLGSQNQTAMPLSEAIEALSLEAMPPDLKRKLGKA